VTPTELRAAVAALHLSDTRGRASQARFLDELDRLPRPFDEDADPVHVTASAVVAGPRGILLHRHKRLGIWLQPGGHIDPGEDPAAAALREVAEETGVAAEHHADGPLLLHLDVHDAPRGHVHLDLRYLLTAGDVDPAPGADESPDVAWFALPDALGLADPGLVGALRPLR
jgi:8-oxo-dGTP pyrophosphatase MutT (NUDIX family)